VLPIDLSSAIEMAACSDTGQVRSHNEDAVLTNAAQGLAVLADGMGGYNAGEVASGMATAGLGADLGAIAANLLETRAALVDAIARANAAIYQAAQSQAQCAGMGTTLVTMRFFDNRLIVAHIGDSRCYRLRGEALTQLTRDHSLLQEQIDSGIITAEQARFSQNKNLVTRALGVDAEVNTEVNEYEVLPGDVYLLCSDGLNDMVEDAEIAMTLEALAANLPLCAAQLVQMANDNGGRDNVSVILAKVKEPFPAARPTGGWWGRVMSWFGKR